MTPNYNEQFKIRIVNSDKSMDFHDIVKLMVVRKILYKYRKKKNHQIVYTEYLIGCKKCDVFHLNNLTKESVAYEIQKNVSRKWIDETNSAYEKLDIDWVLIDLNKLSKDLDVLTKQIEKLII